MDNLLTESPTQVTIDAKHTYNTIDTPFYTNCDKGKDVEIVDDKVNDYQDKGAEIADYEGHGYHDKGGAIADN